MSDDTPKSALELAMARLKKQDADAGVVEHKLTDAQKAAIAEARSVYEARVAERQIMHREKQLTTVRPGAGRSHRAGIPARPRAIRVGPRRQNQQDPAGDGIEVTRAALCLLIVVCGAVPGVSRAQEDVLGRIRQEALDRSQVYALFSTLTDQIGPRLAGTPAYKQSAEWTRDRMREYGLADARLEPFPFGRGWVLDRLVIEMVEPRYMPLIGYAEAWSPSTKGEIVATPIFLGGRSAAEVAAHEGSRQSQRRDRHDRAADTVHARGSAAADRCPTRRSGSASRHG